MNLDIAEKWVAALEFGEYEQGTGRLRKPGVPYERNCQYCCLGVLTDLYIKETGAGAWDYGTLFRSHTNEVGDKFLSMIVQDWAGMRTSIGAYVDHNSQRATSLMSQNDADHSFADIANSIRNNAEKL